MGAQDDAFTPGTHMATSLHDLERVGVIDVGSNSVRLVVFDGVARAPAYFYNEKVLAGLGRGVRETGVLHPDGRARALAALRRFMTLAAQMDLKSVTAVATAAVREAEDGADFVSEVARETGLTLRIITGEEEAILAAQGVLLGRPAARGLVCDIGGASMELARISKGEVKDGITTPLAPLTLGDMSESARAQAVRATMEQIVSRFPRRGRTLYLVGGSWRAIGRLDMVLRGYPLRVLQSYTMAADDCLNTAEWATDRTASELKEITPETSSARLGLVPLAANVLVSLVETLEPSDVVISSYGLREGLLYAQMTPELRALDPLLEAAGHMEASSARFPGFGAALYEWMSPLYADASKEEKRLIRAASLLHDVTWRAHPDYRAEVCFETVTRANLGGLSHQERIFLGLALTRRYKSGTQTPKITELSKLLSPEEEAKSVALGRALRLGSMLSGDATAILARARLRIVDGRLELRLKNDAAMHAGEIVERRLQALAGSHGLVGEVVVGKS